MDVTTPAAPAGQERKLGRDKEYETIYILRPDVDSEAAERVCRLASPTLLSASEASW